MQSLAPSTRKKHSRSYRIEAILAFQQPQTYIYKVPLFFSRGLSFLFSPQFDTPQRRENCCGSRVNAPGASRAPPHKYLRYIYIYIYIYRVDFLLDYSSRSTPGKSIFMRRVGVPRCATLKGKDYTGSSVNNDAHLLEKGEYSPSEGGEVSRLCKNKKQLELIPLLSSGNSRRNDAYTRTRYDARLEF